MVFPKPGLKYRYKYKLPDHILRKEKPSLNRDHTKIYELLSDDDLLDIRGAGLRKQDDEEAELFEIQKKENEKWKEAENKIKKNAPTTATKKKERNSLIGALKMPKIKVEVRNNVKQEIKDDVKKVTPVTVEKKVPPIILYDENWLSSTRPRKRKSVESESPVLAKKALSGTDDSSKENNNGKRKSKSSKRKKDKSKNKTSAADPKPKAWRVRGVAKGKGKSTSKRQGKRKRRISALHACKEDPSNESESSEDSLFSQLPSLSSSSPSTLPVVKKKRGPYKKRVVSNQPSNSKAKAKKAKTKKQASQQPTKPLTPKQALRRVRYKIEKHFAKMPGMQYRCPKMNDFASQIQGYDKSKKKVWLCLVCHKEELDDNGDVMICCDGDNCEDWYHLRCIGVADEKYPENMKWYCKRCMAKEVRAGTFNEDKYPLYIDH